MLEILDDSTDKLLETFLSRENRDLIIDPEIVSKFDSSDQQV